MTLEELQTIFMNGFADEVTGDTDRGPVNHVYRVDNCLVTTDSLGFHYVVWYATFYGGRSSIRRHRF